MDRAVIVVPWYRERLTSDERVSLQHLLHYLGHRQIVILKPEGLLGTLDERPTETFTDSYFESVDTYSRLLLSQDFYRRFEQHEWILLYQLDALALADRLDEWLDMTWDYIGAPWLADRLAPEKGFGRVGNGGFCLRRVESCLRVLEQGQPPNSLRDLFRTALPDQTTGHTITRLFKKLRVLSQASRGVSWYADNYTLNEDHFWSDRAQLFDSRFSVAPVEAALDFSFEFAPRLAFEENRNRLPFGAHAWAKHERSFWEQYLLPPTSKVGTAS